jgi:hypothetical protein
VTIFQRDRIEWEKFPPELGKISQSKLADEGIRQVSKRSGSGRVAKRSGQPGHTEAVLDHSKYLRDPGHDLIRRYGLPRSMQIRRSRHTGSGGRL